MNTDLGLPLRDLRTGSHSKHHDLITQLLHIQDTYLLHNLKSLSWITNLQCLTTLNPLARKRKHLSSSPDQHTLTRTTVNGRTGAYIAISYPWEPSAHPSTLDNPRTGALWRIKASPSSAPDPSRHGRAAHVPSAVRDAVLTRAARCAAALGCPNVWIDRECVPQHAGPENEAALHTMDLVYQFSAWPVALLFNPLASERELRVFERVMGRELLARGSRRRRRSRQAGGGGGGGGGGGVGGGVGGFGGGVELAEGVGADAAGEALRVLRDVTKDPWWERAWTFQENYCAGPRMNLLIPLKSGKWWRRRRKGEVWRTGDVPGELMVSSVEFHKAATRFCLAFLKSEFISGEQRETCHAVIRKAGRYSYTILYDGIAGVWDYSRTMTTRILEDIAHRNARFRADLLPIASNCCQYGVRLDTNRLYNSDTNLSACILALWLLNGEIFKSEVSHTADELAGMSIFEYLKAISLDNFSPPVQKGQLTFLKTCRFVDVQLSEYGITTSGWLWKVDRRISTKDPKFRKWRKRHKGKATPSSPSDSMEEQTFKLLADELRAQGFHGLAELLKRNKYFADLGEKQGGEGDGGEKPTPAETYMRIAARNLERAIAKGYAVLLGRLWDGQSGKEEEDENSLPPHTAIFVGDREIDNEEDNIRDVPSNDLAGSGSRCQGESCSGPSTSPTPADEVAPQQPFVPTYAFTAWSGRSEDDDRNVEESQIDKYVSLEVAVDGERVNGIPLLRARRWLNGLCFFGRDAEMNVTFAWPPGLRDLRKELDVG